MRSYEIYLESSAAGQCMAHVTGLPGCIARGESREEVLNRLPEAIAAYHAWLLRHGEPHVDSSELGADGLELQVVGEREGVGPFDPGDAAALLPTDREPVSLEEVEGFLRLSGYARSDLLALARPLPQALLEWQPYPDWFSIARILRHVGNAEQWYVSRLVAPETLPQEWEHDADMDLFEFLEMERHSAFARLRQLTPQERGCVFAPDVWTQHPDEAWTLRKVLRRFLEHELEHTAQVRRIIDLYRRGLAARLAARQTELLEPLLGLGEKALTRESVTRDRTAKGLLAEIVAEERQQLQVAGAARESELTGLRGPEDEVRREGPGTSAAARQEPGLEEVLVALELVQAAWLAWLAAVPEETLFRGGSSSSPVERIAALSRRLRGAAQELATWREDRWRLEVGVPCATVLRAALGAGRRELEAACEGILAGEPARPVCGTWTLHDVVGHLADWELFGREGLRHMAERNASGPLPLEPVTDIDAWNEAHAAARRGQSWESVWAALWEARKALLETLGGIGQAALARRFAFPWGGEGTPYQWLCVYLAHDREHAAGLRAALVIPAI